MTDDEQQSLKVGFIDRVLGEWDDQKGDVRRHAADILQSNETEQRLDLHKAILQLFAGELTPRIITTNFDRLLIRALESEGLATEDRWRIMYAPDLPPARRFSGICFLHGSVNEPAEMVLTDKDIGRAYMDEGWALRFAHSTFQRFSVLFIGYSLEDPPLRYLSLALEGTEDRGRWALLPEPTEPSKKDAITLDWRRRHVEPIWYPVKDRDYRALGRTVHAWATDNAMSFLDRRSVLAGVGKAKPSHLKPHELNRARYFLQDPPSLRDFVQSALDIEWFETLVTWGHFDFLMKGLGGPKETDGPLAQTLVRWMFLDPVHMVGSLSVHRRTLHSMILEQFCREYEKGNTEKVDAFMLRGILEFFRPAIDKAPSLALLTLNIKRMLSTLIDVGYNEDACALFAALLRTYSAITKSRSLEYEYAKSQGRETGSIEEYELHYDLHFESDLAEHVAKEVFSRVLSPRIGAFGLKLAYCLTGRLLELRAIGSLGQRHQLSTEHLRSAIEPHEQDSFRHDPINVVLDLLRDCWDALLRVNRAQAEDVYWSWLPLKDGLFERLCLYAFRRMIEAEND